MLGIQSFATAMLQLLLRVPLHRAQARAKEKAQANESRSSSTVTRTAEIRGLLAHDSVTTVAQMKSLL